VVCPSLAAANALAPAPEAIEALVEELRPLASHDGLALIEDPRERTRLSRDCFEYSPVLTPLLEACRADLVARPSTVDQVMAVAGACARHRVPLTCRGAGTGNYGQCVPLAGGLVLDLSRLRGLLHWDGAQGAATLGPGTLLAEADAALAAHGRALRLAPSTWRSATVGGFIAGGSGGIGSLRWGFLRDAGNLLGLEVVTLESEPRRLQLDAAASEGLNHAYGCNGILTAVTLATCPAVAWQQLVVEFLDWEAALSAARELPTTALELNALCLLEAPLAAGLPGPSDCPPPQSGAHRLLLLAAPDTLAVLPRWLSRRGGSLVWQAPQGHSRGLPLRELTWNHTTLHWRAQHPEWTYLQLVLPQPEAAALAALRDRWGTDLLFHLEGVRSGGAARLAALPLVRWRGATALEALMAQVRDLGGVLFNPHVLTVEDGGLGVVDADQVAAKSSFDPNGLLNPGKLRGWLERPGQLRDTQG
jgi:FAD/FMN-containing dehydrogenase